MRYVEEKEIWKEYPLNIEFDSDYKIEVSNKGRLRTFNKLHPDGKILECSLQGGFKCLRSTLWKNRSQSDEQKVEKLQAEIAAYNQKIKQLGTSEEELAEKVQLRAEREEIALAKSKLIKRLNKKYRIYFCVLVHRAVAEVFLEKPDSEDQKFIIHKDFDKLNNKASNLEWVNQETLNSRYMHHPKNVLYQFKMQFMDGKKKVKHAKLNENQVLIIKKRLKKGYPLNRLSRQFGVSDMQIHRIKTGENWGHVKLVEDLVEDQKK